MKARRKSKVTALEMAMRLLARRRYFTQELENRLLKKFSPQEARKAVQTLKNAGYLNDIETSLVAVEEWILKRGRGIHWVETLLRKYGLNEEAKVRAMARAEMIEIQGADFVARRMLKKNRNIPEIRTALYRRGFRRDTVETLISSIGGTTNHANTEYSGHSYDHDYHSSGNGHRSYPRSYTREKAGEA